MDLTGTLTGIESLAARRLVTEACGKLETQGSLAETLATMKTITLPNALTNAVYVKGLQEPLESVAQLLEADGKRNFARALREASTVCQAFANVNLLKEAKLAE